MVQVAFQALIQNILVLWMLMISSRDSLEVETHLQTSLTMMMISDLEGLEEDLGQVLV